MFGAGGNSYMNQFSPAVKIAQGDDEDAKKADPLRAVREARERRMAYDSEMRAVLQRKEKELAQKIAEMNAAQEKANRSSVPLLPAVPTAGEEAAHQLQEVDFTKANFSVEEEKRRLEKAMEEKVQIDTNSPTHIYIYIYYIYIYIYVISTHVNVRMCVCISIPLWVFVRA
jgi:hypothetical protein